MTNLEISSVLLQVGIVPVLYKTGACNLPTCMKLVSVFKLPYTDTHQNFIPRHNNFTRNC